MISEETYYVVDSLGVSHPETIERARVTLPQLFVEGGLGWMIGISLFLIAMLIAAWKAPRWVREIGIGALIFAIFGTLMGLLQILNALRTRHYDDPSLRFLRASRFVFEGAPHLKWTLDGEEAEGASVTEIRNIHNAVTIRR